MNPAVISRTIEDTEDLISEHVTNDPTAFYSYAEFEASLGYTMIGDIFGLQGFVDDRTENMIDQLSGNRPIEGDGSGSCGGTIPGPPGGGQRVRYTQANAMSRSTTLPNWTSIMLRTRR